jgi:hypothetical protein
MGENDRKRGANREIKEIIKGGQGWKMVRRERAMEP